MEGDKVDTRRDLEVDKAYSWGVTYSPRRATLFNAPCFMEFAGNGRDNRWVAYRWQVLGVNGGRLIRYFWQLATARWETV